MLAPIQTGPPGSRTGDFAPLAEAAEPVDSLQLPGPGPPAEAGQAGAEPLRAEAESAELSPSEQETGPWRGQDSTLGRDPGYRRGSRMKRRLRVGSRPRLAGLARWSRAKTPEPTKRPKRHHQRSTANSKAHQPNQRPNRRGLRQNRDLPLGVLLSCADITH